MRAPGQREVAAQFLGYLQDRLQDGAVYRDPVLRRQRHPAEIGEPMRKILRKMANAVRWNDSDVDRCLGEMLSEPRQSVVFAPPPRMNAARFAAAVDRRGVMLDMKTRMLFDRARFYINGESFSAAKADAKILRTLADTRELEAGVRLSCNALQLLHDWHAAGYLQLGAHRQPAHTRR